MQAEINSQANYCSGEEYNSESENEEIVNLALVAVHDSEVSSNTIPKVPQILDLNVIDCDSNGENRSDTTSESITKNLSNGSTPKFASLIEEMHDILLRESSKINSMHSNVISLETKVKELESIVLELYTKPRE